MQMCHKISIVVPIYNVEAYLKRCVDSLLGQSYQNMEILLVDDCSTDNSAEIAQGYARKYPSQCRFVQRQVNGGLPAARNSGLDAATGEYITFVDSDDWVSKEYLSTLLETALKDGADITTASFSYIYPNGKQKRLSSPIKTEDTQQVKVAVGRPSATGRLYRMDFLRQHQLRFPTNVRRAEDFGFAIPAFTRTPKTSFMDIPLYYYWQRSTSISNTNQKGIDVSFYDIAMENMVKGAAPGFELELEYRLICELMYGKIMIMIRSGRSKREIAEQVDRFNKQHPDWKKNPYLVYLPRAKRIFVSCAQKKRYHLLKLLIKAWDVKQKLW